MRMIYFYAYLSKLLQFDTMKARLNITIDAPLLAEVKKVAFKQKTSVSEIVENYLSTFVKMKKRKTLTELIDELPKKYISEDRDLIDEYYQAKLKKYGL
jgi:hypothetical protein